MTPSPWHYLYWIQPLHHFATRGHVYVVTVSQMESFSPH